VIALAISPADFEGSDIAGIFGMTIDIGGGSGISGMTIDIGGGAGISGMAIDIGGGAGRPLGGVAREGSLLPPPLGITCSPFCRIAGNSSTFSPS